MLLRPVKSVAPPCERIHPELIPLLLPLLLLLLPLLQVQAMGLGKVARVTGLDPAKPFFELATEEDRIDRLDRRRTG